MANELHREVSDFLKDYGAKNIRVVPGGKHPRIAFNFKGEEQFTVVPSSASDRRSLANQLADIKRKLGPPLSEPVLRKRRLEEMMPQPQPQPQPQTTIKTGPRQHGNNGSTEPRHFTPFANAPGEFAMLPLRELHVDERYQRTLNKRAVERVAKNWSWPACGVLLVSRRPDGRYYIFDGQHRWESAKASAGAKWGKEIEALPCLVFNDLSFKDEAKGFLGANTERRAMYVAQQYNALIVAGDPMALKARELVQVAKREVAMGAGPKTISCISGIIRALRLDEAALRRVWPVICAVLEGRLFHERVVKGLFHLERRMPEGRSLSEPRFIERLLSVGAEAILRSIRDAVAIEGTASTRVVAMGVLRAFNKGNRAPLRVQID